MKLCLTVAFGMVFAIASVRADMANYESTVAGQSPGYLFNFDNSLSSDVGSPSGTFVGSGTTGFGNDYSGNANDALTSSGNTSGYTLSTPNIISGAGSTTSSGTFSFLLNLASVGGTEYWFSASDNTSGTANANGAASSALALDYSGGALQLKVANHSTPLASLITLGANTWYYVAATWSFDGVPADDVVNVYIGAAGGTLASGTTGPTGGALAFSGWSSTGTVGDGGVVTLGNRRVFTLTNGTSGSYDELATWNSILTAGQIQAQFDALATSVPEPSTFAFIGMGTLSVLGLRRKIN